MTDKRLLSYVERIEKLVAERTGINDDIRDVFTEATSAGYDAPTMRELLKLRGMDASDRDEAEYLLDTYKSGVGMGHAPGPLSEDSRLAQVAAMFRAKKTVKQVAVLIGVGNGTAGRLRKKAEALGLLKPHPIPSHVVGMPPHDGATGEIIETPNSAGGSTLPLAGNDAARSSSAPQSPPTETDSPAGTPPNGVAATGPAAAEPPPAAPAGDADEPTVSVSVHHGGEVLADSGPLPIGTFQALADFDPARDMPPCLRRGKAVAV